MSAAAAPARRTVEVVLENIGGEIDRAVLTIEDGPDFDDEVDQQVEEVLESWILSVGDVIRIRESFPVEATK